jgi:CDP-6-deoxy-D-xylo-4-hexulose-3-dehydrase
MIKLIKSSYYNEAETSKKLANFIVSTKQLSFGSECEKFEDNFSTYQGRKECVFLNSGSSANLAIIQALINLGRLKKGDKIGFSALTWSTNVMPIIQLGLVAIPIDVEINTLNVSSQTFKKILTNYPDIKMLFITNLLGWTNDIDEIAKICVSNNILLIEDNCESLGSVYMGKKLGNFGLASTFSFYVGHHMSTVEGGAVCTDDEELATMIRLVRAHGWDRNLSSDQQLLMRKKFNVNSTFYSRYTFYDLGFNLRPTEISGFLGNNQLQYLDQIIRIRESNYAEIASEILSSDEKYFKLKTEHMDVFSNFAIPLICRNINIRDELVKKCHENIEIRPVVGGDMTEQPFYLKYMSEYKTGISVSNASLIHHQGLYFGNNPDLTKEEKQYIIKTFQ